MFGWGGRSRERPILRAGDDTAAAMAASRLMAHTVQPNQNRGGRCASRASRATPPGNHPGCAAWTFMVRSGWEEGPWEDEPDKMTWTCGRTGAPCILRRSQTGSWAGYVGLQQGHPLYLKSFTHAWVRQLRVHGGVTYSGRNVPRAIAGLNEGLDISHPSASDDTWWLGFDCCHPTDVRPADAAVEVQPDVIDMHSTLPAPDLAPGVSVERAVPRHPPQYRTLPYAEAHVFYLARQIWVVARGLSPGEASAEGVPSLTDPVRVLRRKGPKKLPEPPAQASLADPAGDAPRAPT